MGGIVAFVKYKYEAFYCIAETEFWFMDSWYLYIGDETNLEAQYVEFLKAQFRVDTDDLRLNFEHVFKSGDDFDKTMIKPLLYIDFDEKMLVSYYYEQDLEEHVLEGWIGKYAEVYQFIPKELRYWH